VEKGLVPANNLFELDPIDAWEIELEENIRRRDLTWQEQARATEELLRLRQAQAKRDNLPAPTVATIAQELRGSDKGASQETTRREIIVAKHLSDPDVAKAKNVDEAFKTLKRKEEAKKNEALGNAVGKTFSVDSHALYRGNCLENMKVIRPDFFDCILTDPPYGIDAQDFNDSAGKSHGGHFYDDSLETWIPLMKAFAEQSFNLAKPQAHAYVFCDIENFAMLKSFMLEAGWKPFRTPIVWFNPDSQRAPWPNHGPQRKYQVCLFAIKGDRPVLKVAPDLVEYRSDDNLGHPAQKPVGLFQDLLLRTCRPGDTVLDPFCGSGTIFRAAHPLKIAAVGIEKDPAAYGIAVKSLGELK
jgi:DNA modification methylase